MSCPAAYPIDVSDEEWLFAAPDLRLTKEDAPQREHSLRAVFNALRRDGARRGALAAAAYELTAPFGLLFTSRANVGCGRGCLRRDINHA